MKKQSFIIFMAVVILLSSINLSYVKAEENSCTSRTIYAVTDLSKEAKEEIEKQNVVLTNDSIIELQTVKLNDERGAEKDIQVIVITNINNNIATKDVLQYMQGDLFGTQEEPSSNNACFSVNASSGYIDFQPYNAPFVIHGSATYNVYYGSAYRIYYQPVSVCFYWTKVSNFNYSLGTVVVSYNTFGDVYNVSTETYIMYDDYTITVSKNNPSISTIYRTTNQYTSGRGFLLSEGLCGASLYFQVGSYYYSVSL